MEISRLESLLWLIFKVNLAAIFVKLLTDFFIFKMVIQKTRGFQEEKSAAGAKEVRSVATPSEGPDPVSMPTAPIRMPLEDDRVINERRERDKRRIGEILLTNGMITRDILTRALEHQKRYGGSVTQYLLHYGYIDERQLANCLCSQFRVPYLPIDSYVIADEVLELIPTDIAEKYWVLPVEKNANTLTVVMIDPLDTKVIKELEELTGLRIIPFVGIISEIVSALQIYYKLFVKDQKTALPPFFIDTKTYTGMERRASIRYMTRIPVRFPAAEHYQRSQTIDVSRDGFRFTSDRAIPVETLLPLEINLPPEISALPIVTVTQVVRCAPKTTGGCEIAVKTLKISEQEMGAIMNYAVDHMDIPEQGIPPG